MNRLALRLDPERQIHHHMVLNPGASGVSLIVLQFGPPLGHHGFDQGIDLLRR